ncbi:unnamed protein product [Lactuca saligna]|uniref:Prolyl endopeptidase-like n=1 Tax=Lactuca saligna TaxID=75948 RepID=A0AA35YP13_LACSI|nr:unnamed protein product [Lactuca saligna]
MRPDFFKATVVGVPFVDVVTTMLGPTIPLITVEWEEWGDPRKEEFYFYMKSYSPVDNASKSLELSSHSCYYWNNGIATVKGYGTGDIHPNVSGSEGSNWNGGNNNRGSHNSVNKDKQGQSSPGSMEKISAESCPASDRLVNNSDSGQTEAIESKCDTRVNSNIGNHDCLNPMKDILHIIEVKKQGRKERRHKEAQDVLATATTAAATSSKLSSFRKDTLEESAHHELTRIGRDVVLYVESLIESIMGGLEGLINILDSKGGFGSLETHRSWEPSDKADLHFVYKDVEGVSTQWDDIQRKLRNLPPKPSASNPIPSLLQKTKIPNLKPNLGSITRQKNSKI